MKKTFDFTGWTTDERRELADMIYKNLGIERQINIGEELAAHYQRCNRAADIAYRELEMGNATAGTAAVLAATTNALKQLADLDSDLYNIEYARKLEKAFIDTLKQADDAERLLEIFEDILRDAA